MKTLSDRKNPLCIRYRLFKERARSKAIALRNTEAESFMMLSLIFDSSCDTQPQPQNHQQMMQTAFKPQWRREERFHWSTQGALLMSQMTLEVHVHPEAPS